MLSSLFIDYYDPNWLEFIQVSKAITANTMAFITNSVGNNGANNKRDVKVVQRLLNKHVKPPLRYLQVDGIAGNNTKSAIRDFQSTVVKMRNPDGRVDPRGKTLRSLNQGVNKADNSNSRIVKKVNSNSPQLSGETWWRANQRKYPNSNRIESLQGGFREKVSSFIDAIREGGASVTINSTKRNKIRAHLMHYSWKVSKGMIDASQVPGIQGLDIIWDHGNNESSKRGATEMVRLFRLAHIASLNSNHIRGQAIDMNISWRGNLEIKVPGKPIKKVISSGPRTGAKNRELHRLGREFGVYKLLSDPPHWSFNGK